MISILAVGGRRRPRRPQNDFSCWRLVLVAASVVALFAAAAAAAETSVDFRAVLSAFGTSDTSAWGTDEAVAATLDLRDALLSANYTSAMFEDLTGNRAIAPEAWDESRFIARLREAAADNT